MSVFYSIEIENKTAEFIAKRFHVSSEYAHRLALATLNGIESHGLDSMDWMIVEETVTVVVKAWVENGTYK